MMDELRHFLLILEHGTFTEAARHAHLSQPALTASIHRLEDELGARLLHRGPGGVRPTAAGDALLPRARAALAAVEEARRAIEEVEGLRAGEVRLGGGATVCTYLLPPVVAEFRRRHPGIRFRLREAATDAVLDALDAGELDLGVVVARPGLDGEGWKRDELVLIASPRIEAKTAPYVTFTQGTNTREMFDRHFPDANVVMELGSIAAVKGNVRAGIGIALVSRAAVETDLAAGRLVEVRDRRTPIRREWILVHRGEARLSPASAELRRMMLQRPRST
jgi:DNA-binding transcriptional LysR family regulator